MKKQLQLFFSIAVAVFFGMNTYAQIPDTLSTSYENGADAHVANDEKNGPDDNFGKFEYLVIRNHEVRQRIIYLKFDIYDNPLFAGANDAYIGLNVKYAEKMATDETSLDISIYGLIEEGDNDEWVDSLLTYSTAPGLDEADINTYELASDSVEFLTTITIPADSVGWVFSENSKEMDAFINADKNGLLTFILLIEETNTGDEVRIFTEEANNNNSPILLGGEPVGIKENKFESSSIMAKNFPNPFKGTTTLTYTINKSEHVELTIYNMLGAKITTLVNEFQKTGEYSVKVDMDRLQLPQGTYIAKFNVGSDSKSIKMFYSK